MYLADLRLGLDGVREMTALGHFLPFRPSLAQRLLAGLKRTLRGLRIEGFDGLLTARSRRRPVPPGCRGPVSPDRSGVGCSALTPSVSLAADCNTPLDR